MKVIPGTHSNLDIYILYSFFIFLISDHCIQKPCHVINLCSPGELHRGPVVYITHLNSENIMSDKNTLSFIHKMKITNIHVHLI
jgi:hypothetical protein